MKKVLCLMSFILVMGLSATVFAAPLSGLYTFGDAGGSAASTCYYGLSNRVYLDYSTDTTNYQDYRLGCKHLSGNREFYTTNQTSKIYYHESDTYKGSTALTHFGDGSAGATTWSGSEL